MSLTMMIQAMVDGHRYRKHSRVQTSAKANQSKLCQKVLEYP